LPIFRFSAFGISAFPPLTATRASAVILPAMGAAQGEAAGSEIAKNFAFWILHSARNYAPQSQRTGYAEMQPLISGPDGWT
jgi:hypothetical protein